MPETIPRHAKLETLSSRPKRLRTSPCRGLKVSDRESPIERTGGIFAAGLIKGVSLCTRGEALGHNLWLDREFIVSVVSAANTLAKGVKCRFTHPGLSSDGLGTFIGRFLDCRLSVDGEAVKAIGDLHISQAAHRTPDGDLAGYVMDLAEEDPSAFAMSIVFEEDFKAETEFILAHGGTVSESGYVSTAGFKSPDGDNTNNYEHARLAALLACDVVDEPAANPDGLFHREQQFAQEAEAAASFALGLSQARPTLVNLSLDADRVRAFVQRFLDTHNLQVIPKETTTMETKTKQTEQPDSPVEQPQGDALSNEPEGTSETPSAEAPAAEPIEEPAKVEQSQGEEPSQPEGTVETPAEEEPEQPVEQSAGDAGRAECKKFIDAFGDQGGAWYAEGLSFEQAQQRHVDQLTAENDALKKKLQAAGESAGESEPLTFQVTPKEKQAKPATANSLGENLDRYAQNVKMPS
ncbi:MAG: hypothetical protein BWX88_05010 [Planctomycetes bacterium ADurb.Bin126]|nr:MAG: hypothetical protein BWX88_05010 [Planctomycetes bacterium ADurb.Bin126]HOD84296.1 hypothetical protein [Phycisphaerae bacterium]